ncbi:enhanced serine sensitivity protein SseB C-terminal domain-containing protein, partial [[Kitasatospora] papulosa]
EQSVPLDALGRALGRVQVPWPVNLVLLDVAQDPVGDWMLEKVRPFYRRDGY